MPENENEGNKTVIETTQPIPEPVIVPNDDEHSSDNEDVSVDKVPKKKYAIYFGYCGTNYQGLQINGDTNTIELKIIDALHKANLVSDVNFEGERTFQKIQYMRAARTDKGVHAAGNCVSCKLLIKPGDEDKACESLNSFLPSDIRVFKLERVCRGFNAKNSCDKRRYEYVLPLSVLAAKGGRAIPSIEEELCSSWEGYKEYKEEKEKGLDPLGGDILIQDKDRKQIYNRISLQTACALEDYVNNYKYIPDLQDEMLGGIVPLKECPAMTEFVIKRLRAALYIYKGTHKFHNYTIGKNSMDPRSSRYMMGFTCSDPVYIENTLYLRLCVEGQSFMLNQIRKMIGMAIEVTRGTITLYHLWETLGKGSVNTPVAPGEGLFLDYCIYDMYNKKPTSVIKVDFCKPDILKVRSLFKMSFIYKEIASQFQSQQIYEKWIQDIDDHCDGYPIIPVDINKIPEMEKYAQNKIRKDKTKKNANFALKDRNHDDEQGNPKRKCTEDDEQKCNRDSINEE
ncbi:hypothetical protein WA158_002670 [Blastocystis sp. Blastoise]